MGEIFFLPEPEKFIALGGYGTDEVAKRLEAYEALASQVPEVAGEFCDLTGAKLPPLLVVPSAGDDSGSQEHLKEMFGGLFLSFEFKNGKGNFALRLASPYLADISLQGCQAYLDSFSDKGGPLGTERKFAVLGLSPYANKKAIRHEFGHATMVAKKGWSSGNVPIPDGGEFYFMTSLEGVFLPLREYCASKEIPLMQAPCEYAASLAEALVEENKGAASQAAWPTDSVCNTEECLESVARSLIEHWGGLVWDEYMLTKDPSAGEALERFKRVLGARDYVRETLDQERELLPKDFRAPLADSLSAELTEELIAKSPELFVVGERV